MLERLDEPKTNKIFLFFIFFTAILDLIHHYILTPLLTKIFPHSNIGNQISELLLIVTIIVVCYFLLKKLNQEKSEIEEEMFALWGAVCIFCGEMLFRIVAFYLIDQIATIDDIPFMVKDTAVLSLEAGFISYVIIHKIRGESIFIPLMRALSVFLILDYLYLYAMN